MISVKDSQDLINQLIFLRQAFEKSGESKDKMALEKQENLCIENFSYLVTMHAKRYRAFANYEDLMQDGLESLIKAMKTYNPKKGNFFWWAHKYIGTKISRMANLHTTIRYPLKFAKATTPHKESKLPILIENTRIPDKEYENMQTENLIHASMAATILTDEEKNILTMAYGLDGDKPLSINKICINLGITRTTCKNIIDKALHTLMKNIRL